VSAPRVVHRFPRPVRQIENRFVTLADGCRLAARIWLPEDAETDPVPAILECIPYRKRDFTRSRDEPMHGYFAGHGYAAVRLDVRGSGDSAGVLDDEYTERELADAVEVIAWLAQQPWCTGRVGMMGISWGGINTLQVAALQPPELRAVMTLCSADDRYADDAHYMGGCLLNENLTWGTVLTMFQALPPDPEIVGEGWRDMWLERLRSARPFPAVWLSHQRRDGYWKRGSVSEDLARIRCPVYAVGGWADGYSNVVPRLLAGLQVECKGLVGPWAHVFPHDGRPGPRIGFLQEALRWWDQWLKDQDTGILDEPAYRVWMQDSVRPQPTQDGRPGRWVAEVRWPSARIGTRTLYLNVNRLDDTAGAESPLEVSSPQTIGLGAGDWCAFGTGGEMPIDQRADDGKSLVFDSQPLEERLEILGAPRVVLELSADRPVATVAVRLEDVLPDGASARVTYGLLNLTHRDGHECPTPLEPGRRYQVTVQLNDTAHAFPPGHVLRVAVSTSYWPIVWPSPEPVRLKVFAGASKLLLPVRPPDPADTRLRPFAVPEHGPPLEHTLLHPERMQRTIERDLRTDETIYTVLSRGGEFEGASIARIDAIDLEVGTSTFRRYRIDDRDPLSARAEVALHTLLRRRGWSVRVEVDMRMAASAQEFHVDGELRAFAGSESVHRRLFRERIPRDLV